MITSSIINSIKYKKYDSSTDNYTVYREVHDMPVCTFLQCLDNLAVYAEIHWSMDFLNPDHTTATVYLKFH